MEKLPQERFKVYWCGLCGQQEEKILRLLSKHKCFSLLASHAVEDKTHEDEGVVAVERVHVFHHPLAQLSKVAGF